MIMRLPVLLLCACSTLAGFPPATTAPFATLGSTRAFYNTPDGQIHYALGGDLSSAPLVLFHSHPRSITEFKYLVEALPDTSFVAFDYFGFGGSDDCRTCDASLNTVVSLSQFAEYCSQVLTLLNVTSFVPMGSLKGAAIATRLAATDSRSEKLILSNPAYWFPDVEAKIRSYLEVIKHPIINADGSHLIRAWNDTSASPFPNLFKMEEKTLDELRSDFVGWQYVLAELNNNNNTLPDMASFSGSCLLLWGGIAMQQLNAFGFRPTEFRAKIEATLKHPEILTLEYGSQGMVAANATVVASSISKFLR